MSHLALCGRHHWIHHDHQLPATNLITALFGPQFSGLCHSLLRAQMSDLCRPPLLPRALYHPYQTPRPTAVIPLLSFNRAAWSTCTTLAPAPFLFTIPIEPASFALASSGSVQQALSAMPLARSLPLACPGIPDKTLFVGRLPAEPALPDNAEQKGPTIYSLNIPD